MFYGSFSAPQWCGGCGRKLGADGRCGGCDTWWSSPLVTVGGPLVGATLFLLAVTIGVFRADDPAPSRSQPAPSAVLAARPLETMREDPLRIFQHRGCLLRSPHPVMPVFPSRPPPQPVPIVALPGPSEEQRQLERLRGMLSCRCGGCRSGARRGWDWCRRRLLSVPPSVPGEPALCPHRRRLPPGSKLLPSETRKCRTNVMKKTTNMMCRKTRTDGSSTGLPPARTRYRR